MNRQGPHPIEALKHLLTPSTPGMQQHFGIRVIRNKLRPITLKLGAEFSEIVDFPVKHDAQFAVTREHGLKTTRNINHSQAALRQMHAIGRIFKQAFAVGATVLKPPRHCAQRD
jgi:hypothetical protein